MDMGYLLSFLAGMCIAIVICDIISHKFFKRKRNKVHFYIARNKVHFYVARDKSSDRLWLYLNKPIRSKHLLQWIGSWGSKPICMEAGFEDVGLNADDYKDLKWEDEPVEVFLNMED